MKNARVWAAFAACLAVVLLAMAWSSLALLRLERAEGAARAQAALEENSRLALWRMDSALTPVLAEESARPYARYGGSGASSAPYVLLRFQIGPDGRVVSPEAAAGDDHRARLAELRGRISTPGLLAQLPREVPRLADAPPADPPADKRQAAAITSLESVQQVKNALEFQARQSVVQKQSKAPSPVAAAAPIPRPPHVEEGALVPLWAGDVLLLARRVRVDGAVHVQGSWLAWPRLQADLLASVRDLLPAARLEPAAGGAASGDDRRLAALPVRLVPGPAPVADASGLSPTRLSLIGAWAGVLLAALAVAALLRGVLDLSERRRVFVSAVTHELRTPLTTFRLYTDMLADGMVSAEDKRRQYLERLRGEAERLSHLVENVLFYSRIESGRAGATRETVELGAFLTEAVARLGDLARTAGLKIELDEPGAEPLPVRLDRSALEQVLVNLVDNACKYAAPSEPPVVRVTAERRDGHAVIRIRDHGPGLSPADRRRLFREFSKSDRDAAASRPGVGLGLALSRRLMRAQGGELSVDDRVKDGAAFVLTLPLG